MKDEAKKSESGTSAFDLVRVIPLESIGREKWRNAAAKLLTIGPIHSASVDQQGHLRIRYDASVIGIRDVESLLDELGLERKNNFWWQMKSGWYRFVDENAQAHACSGAGACCNRPPSANSGAHSQSVKIKQWHFHD